ncbi:MAG: MBL fold metallo-hydrolase [Terrimicrobiaceae bacterium]|nr:MBL fold metallo-hydrolase [Terrimicrobiaceae bacterium]
MALPLEDAYNDVLGKALRGTGKSPSELAAESGVEIDQIRALIDGKFDAAAARAVAVSLGLSPDRVVALGEGTYVPAPVGVEGLRQFNTPFEDMTVNAYLVWDPESNAAAVFDTGTDAGEMLDAAAKIGARIEQVFITHSHGDHIYDFDRLMEKSGAKAWCPKGDEVEGAEVFMPGRTFSVGALSVEARLTCGHARGGVTYVVRGLALPVAVCGDAMFAGSMGGGAVSYADALRTNREAIFSLPDETILAPGHGPLTTVGEQRAHNPFFPEYR